jgi:uncharacterized protein
MYWEKAAEQGTVDKQLSVANGYSSKEDFYQAAKWYRKAADKGDGEALEKLADLYRTGKGVPQDYKQAFDLYLAAAKKGYGHWSLGSMYQHGEWVNVDLVKAYAHYNLAGKSGEMNKDFLSIDLTREQILEAQAMSREWQKNQ